MKKQIKTIIIRWFCFFLIIFILTGILFFRIKPLIFTYAKSCAETIALNAANDAVLAVLEKDNINYDSISKVSRNSEGEILGIEIDIMAINRLKSSVSNELSRLIENNNFYDISIPLGTVSGIDMLLGLGPQLKFNIQMTETAFLDFDSSFSDAGINQTLHQIIIKVNVNLSIVMLGCSESFSVGTSVIAAQTVIVGATPDTFTNVEEYPNNDIADELFNFADLE